MATDTATVQTERKQPTPERFSTGKLKPPKAKTGNDSAPPQETKRGCYICGTIERGDSFTSLPDSDGVGRVVHMAINAESGKAVSRNLDCRTTFETNVAAANKRKVREQQEDLALRAHNRQFPAPAPRGIDCPAPDCSRFFDSQNGVDLHRRRQHKDN